MSDGADVSYVDTVRMVVGGSLTLAIPVCMSGPIPQGNLISAVLSNLYITQGVAPIMLRRVQDDEHSLSQIDQDRPSHPPTNYL